ncbi:MAG: hypothetical protein JNJ83_05260 [Verrucomicrobiaceae bacterium]|nr:hypothetical protein [Verrucomicrobiaceae bacterium]
MSEASRSSLLLRRLFLGALVLTAASLVVFLLTTGATWPQAVAEATKNQKEVRYWEEFQVIFWWTAVGNVVLLAALAATSRWWLLTPNPTQPIPTPSWERPSRLAWVVAGGIMVLAVALRVPRLDNSLYNDEAHCYQRYLSGAWKNNEVKAEPLKFRASPWAETLFRNTAGNNSQLFSTVSRSCVELWKKMFDVAEGEVTETPARIPSLLAGVGALALLGALGWRWRGTQGMLWALLAGALHGWLVRFQSEARGYGIMLLGVMLTFWFLDSAMRLGRWRDWLGFAVGVLICAWSFLGAAYFLIALYLVLMLVQFIRWKRGEVDMHQLVRPLVAGMLAAMVGSQLLSSFIPPIIKQMATFHSIKGEMGSAWWILVTSYHLLGAHWQDYDPTNPDNLAWTRVLSEHPAMWVPVIGFVALLAGGFICMVRSGRAAQVTALTSVVALAVAWVLMSRKGNYLLPWYTIYSTPGFVLAAAWGLSNLSNALKQRITGMGGQFVSLAAGGLLISPLAISGFHWSHSTKQNERAVIEHVRGAIYPHYLGTPGEKPLLLTFWTNATAYDPHAGIMATEADLNAMIERARKEQRPLYLAFAHQGFARTEHVTVFKRLDNPSEFKHVFTSPGQEEEQFTAYVYQWVGQ